MQYIHGLAARGVHYFHRPGPLLQDVGFYLLPVGIGSEANCLTVSFEHVYLYPSNGINTYKLLICVPLGAWSGEILYQRDVIHLCLRIVFLGEYIGYISSVLMVFLK